MDKVDAPLYVILAGFFFWSLMFYINIIRPGVWIQIGNFINQSRESSDKYLQNDLYRAKCRIAGIFAFVGMVVFGYGLMLKLS